MADDRDVVIRIIGKNLTAAEFDAVRGALRGLKKDTKDSTDELGQIWKGLKTTAGLIGVSFGTSAVVGFAAKVFDAASAVHDHAAALGFSAEKYQRYAFAAEQAGSSEETFSKAVGILNDKLAGGEKSTVAALTKAGLKLDEIRAMKPEDAWLTVANAVGKIEDPMLRLNVAQDLVGKGARELLPGMIEGYAQLGAAATVMSDETVRRLEAAQDTWDRIGKKITIVSAETASSVLSAWSPENFKRIWQGLTGGLEEAAVAEGKARVAAAELATEQQRVAAETRKHTDESERQRQAQEKAAAAAKKHADELSKMADVFTGKKIAEETRDLAAALELAAKRGGVTEYQFQQIAKRARELRDQGAPLTTELRGMAHGLDVLDFNQKLVTLSGRPMLESVRNIGRVFRLEGRPAVDEFSLSLADMATQAELHLGATITKIGNLGTKVKELPAPPLGPWHAFEQSAKQTLDGIERATADNVIGLIGHWHGFKDAGAKIWADIDGGIRRILGDLLYEFEHRFIKGMINAISSNEASFTDAFTDIFGRSGRAGGQAAISGIGTEITLGAPAVSSAAAGSGAAAGINWGLAFSTAMDFAVTLGIQAAIVKWGGLVAGPIGDFLFRFGPGTGAQTPVIDQNTGQVIYDPNDPNNPTPGFDPGNPFENGDMGAIGGFASGGLAAGRQLAWLAERGRKEIVGDQTFMAGALVGAMQRLGLDRIISGAGGSSVDGATGATTVLQADIHVHLEGQTIHQSQRAFYRRDRAAAGDFTVTLAGAPAGA